MLRLPAPFSKDIQQLVHCSLWPISHICREHRGWYLGRGQAQRAIICGRHRQQQLYPPQLARIDRCHISPDRSDSKYSQDVRRARNTPGYITRLARHEEAPPALARTRLGELLEPEQLADGAPVAGQQDLVQSPVLRGGPGLERRLVAGHGAEVFPDPTDYLLGLLDATEMRRSESVACLELGV